MSIEGRKDNRSFEIPDLSGRLPVYDGTATIGAKTNGGVPNITGSLEGGHNFLDGDGKSVSGALSFYVGSKRQKTWSSTYNSEYAGFNFDASRSSAVYDSGTTVRPAGVYMNWIIKAF